MIFFLLLLFRNLKCLIFKNNLWFKMYYFKSTKGLILRALTYGRTKWCEMVWRKEVGRGYNKREL